MAEPTLESDRALLQAFRAGERDALARVYRMYVLEVARVIRSGVVVDVDGRRTRLGAALPEAEVEVLVQETFLRAFSPSARARYDGVRPYGAWLATIARNAVIDRARKHRRDARMVSIDDVGEERTVPDGAPVDPTWSLEEKELADGIASVVDELPPRERAVFDARYRRGLSLRDAAQDLEMSIITVRRVDARLRQLLLSRLRELGYLQDARVGIPTLVRDRSKG